MCPLHIERGFTSPAGLIGIKSRIPGHRSQWRKHGERRRVGQPIALVKSVKIGRNGWTAVGIDNDDGLSCTDEPGADEPVQSIGVRISCGE